MKTEGVVELVGRNDGDGGMTADRTMMDSGDVAVTADIM
jgi:hypothetical protein